MNTKSSIGNIISWLFGIAVFAIGLLNMFWGNDPGFGIFLVLLSFIYFPPINSFLLKRTGFSINWIIKLALGIFIIWAAVGVGELFDKIEMIKIPVRPGVSVLVNYRNLISG